MMEEAACRDPPFTGILDVPAFRAGIRVISRPRRGQDPNPCGGQDETYDNDERADPAHRHLLTFCPAAEIGTGFAFAT